MTRFTQSDTVLFRGLSGLDFSVWDVSYVTAMSLL
jgi:hypothetical protein